MNSIALIDYDGNIWCYGNNFHGKLGFGDTLNRYHLEKINMINDAKFIKVEMGYGFMVALDYYGNIWTSGNILKEETHILTLYNTEHQFIDISCGPYYFFAIDTNNHLWSVGSNNYGVLGLDIDKKEIGILTKIPGDIEYQSISCGLAHNLAIDVNNNLWGCGRNLGGVLGNNILPIIYYTFVPIMPNFLVKFVHCTNSSSFIIDLYGDLWSSGDNRALLWKIRIRNF